MMHFQYVERFMEKGHLDLSEPQMKGLGFDETWVDMGAQICPSPSPNNDFWVISYDCVDELCFSILRIIMFCYVIGYKDFVYVSMNMNVSEMFWGGHTPAHVTERQHNES